MGNRPKYIQTDKTLKMRKRPKYENAKQTKIYPN